MRMCCVRVWGFGIDKTKAFCGLSALLVGGVFGKRVCVLVLMVCFVLWHAVGCLGQHKYCCSIDHPLISRTYLVGCCVWGGVLCENCIVDANAIKIATIIIVVVVCFFFFVVLFLVFFVVCA